MSTDEREATNAPVQLLADAWGRQVPTPDIVGVDDNPAVLASHTDTPGRFGLKRINRPLHPQRLGGRRTGTARTFGSTGPALLDAPLAPAGTFPPSVLTPIPAPKADATRPTPSRGARAVERVAALALAVTVLYLVFLPLFDKAVGLTPTWVVYLTFVAVGLVRLGYARRRGAWIAVVALGPWVAWALTWPTWSAWAPDSRTVELEQASLLACGVITLGAIAVAAGTRGGAQLHRLAWLAIGVVGVPIGLWEIVTQQHLGPGPWMPPPWSAAATFPNPNNFAVVLLVVYGLSLGRLTERLSAVDRLLTALLSLGCLVVMVATMSRLAVGAALGLTAAAAVLELRRRGHLTRRSPAARRTGMALVVMAAAVITSLVVPALARVNPLARFLFPGDESTARADGLRVSLIRHGLDLWSENPWFGIGAGRFETLLEEQGGDRIMPMHNGFVEILTEYGLVVALPLILWLAALVWCMVAPLRPGAASATLPWVGVQSTDISRVGRPRSLDPGGARFAIGVWLLGFVVAGLVTSSPLTWHLWYLMAASATGAAWWLRSRA